MEKWLDTVYSDGSQYFVSNPTPHKGETIEVKIRVCESAVLDGMYIRCKKNGIQLIEAMKDIGVQNGFRYYSYTTLVYENEFSYHFMIATKDNIYYYNQFEVVDYEMGEEYNFRILVDYEQPKWVREAVFYQIFPERFCNGNPDNDVRTNEYTFEGHPSLKKNWDDEPEDYDKTFCLDFYGGDLEGIAQKIPYLKKLGVTAIYVNPIFYAATVHKYDCLDYFKVDPHFGGDEALIKLTEELHKNDMKLIIDVSINHTGTANKWFNKDGSFFDKKFGAYNNPDAPERKYYIFDENNKYHCWFGTPTLPTLDYRSEELREIIYKGEDSLVKKWLKPPFNIDGWRFDVADTMARQDEVQLHHEVWPEIRKSIKSVNKDAYILCEDWTDCEEFLKGNEWDSSMNYYGCSRAIREFVGDGDAYLLRNEKLRSIKKNVTADMFDNRVRRYLSKLPTVIWENQFNLIDSHDIERFHLLVKDISLDRYKGAIVLQYMLPGAPSIYYGDEVKIAGQVRNVEGCRYPMPWDESVYDMDYFNLYQTLNYLKQNNKAMQDGGFKKLYAQGHVISYARFAENKVIFNVTSVDKAATTVIVPVQNVGISEKTELNEVFGENTNYSFVEGGLQITIPAEKSYVFEAKLK